MTGAKWQVEIICRGATQELLCPVSIGGSVNLQIQTDHKTFWISMETKLRSEVYVWISLQ